MREIDRYILHIGKAWEAFHQGHRFEFMLLRELLQDIEDCNSVARRHDEAAAFVKDNSGIRVNFFPRLVVNSYPSATIKGIVLTFRMKFEPTWSHGDEVESAASSVIMQMRLERVC